MPEEKLIVSAYKPGGKYRQLALFGGIFILALTLGWIWGGQTFSSAMTEKRDTEAELERLTSKFSEVQEQVNRLQTNATIDKVAMENARQEIIGLQNQLYIRDEEINLFRELMQDKSQPTGLSVGDLKFVQLEDGRIRYLWVARQKTEKMQSLGVFADVYILARKGDKQISLSLSDLDEAVEKLPVRLKFKYFAISQGILTIPEGVKPEKVRISLRYTWKDTPQFDQLFDWKLESYTNR